MRRLWAACIGVTIIGVLAVANGRAAWRHGVAHERRLHPHCTFRLVTTGVQSLSGICGGLRNPCAWVYLNRQSMVIADLLGEHTAVFYGFQSTVRVEELPHGHWTIRAATLLPRARVVVRITSNDLLCN